LPVITINQLGRCLLNPSSYSVTIASTAKVSKDYLVFKYMKAITLWPSETSVKQFTSRHCITTQQTWIFGITDGKTSNHLH